jgi:hypothetical protein
MRASRVTSGRSTADTVAPVKAPTARLRAMR